MWLTDHHPRGEILQEERMQRVQALQDLCSNLYLESCHHQQKEQPEEFQSARPPRYSLFESVENVAHMYTRFGRQLRQLRRCGVMYQERELWGLSWNLPKEIELLRQGKLKLCSLAEIRKNMGFNEMVTRCAWNAQVEHTFFKAWDAVCDCLECLEDSAAAGVSEGA